MPANVAIETYLTAVRAARADADQHDRDRAARLAAQARFNTLGLPRAGAR